MKNSNHCTKCDSTQILKIPGGSTWTGYHNRVGNVGLKPILVTRYLCTKCGFSEEWIEDEKDMDKLIKKYRKDGTHGDFV